jgi:hypothetical protein
MKYTKKPVQVDVWNIGDLIETAKRDALELPIEVQNGCMDLTLHFFDEEILVKKWNGSHSSDSHSYLLKDENGEFFVITPSVLKSAYQPLQPSETETLAAKIEAFENSIKPYVLESVHLDTTHSPKVSFYLRFNRVWEVRLRLNPLAGIPSSVYDQYAMDALGKTMREAFEQLEIKCRQDMEFATLFKTEEQS